MGYNKATLIFFSPSRTIEACLLVFLFVLFYFNSYFIFIVQLFTHSLLLSSHPGIKLPVIVYDIATNQ